MENIELLIFLIAISVLSIYKKYKLWIVIIMLLNIPLFIAISIIDYLIEIKYISNSIFINIFSNIAGVLIVLILLDLIFVCFLEIKSWIVRFIFGNNEKDNITKKH